MRFTLVTLFPEFFASPLGCGQMARAVEAGLVEFCFANPRDFADDLRGTVDDRPYGGGPGMVMLAEPLAQALSGIEKPGRKLMLSPSGRRLTQALARELAREEALTLVCGRYEGIAERLLQAEGLECVCVGDAVLNGGEAAALCLIEAVARLQPGFMGKEESGEDESFSAGLIEYPHYTRPEAYQGRPVPEVLRGGDHAAIRRWRREQALWRTFTRRPELLAEAPLDGGDLDFLRAAANGPTRPPALGRSLFVCLLHHPVLDKAGKPGTVSLTNLDIHDMCRVSRTYALGGLYFVTPLADQRELGGRILGHWTGGAGGRANPDRAEALSLGRMAASLDEVLEAVEKLAGARPKLWATSARGAYARGRGKKPKVLDFLPLCAAREALRTGPALLVLGTGHGLAPEIFERADAVLPPVRPFAPYNHLPVRAAMALLTDRLLGDAL